MGKAAPLTFDRFLKALLAAVTVATAAQAGLVLVLPYLLESSLSALAGNLSDARFHWEVLKPAALARGALGDALCLVPALLLAHRWSGRLGVYALAGALGEFFHNRLSVLLVEPALTKMDSSLFYANLRPETLVLQGDAAIVVASLVAGLMAGAVFATRVLAEEQDKPSFF